MSNENSANGQPESPSGGIGLPDIYFVLFRRKWFVLLGLVVGVAGAAFIWKTRQPLFQSQAKLLVKYVLESRAPIGLTPEAQVRNTDSGAGNVINSEVEILRSLDIATEVAAIVTPEKVLPPRDKRDDDNFAPMLAAAGMILKNFNVDAPNRGSILNLSFQHSDPAIARIVLENLIDVYLRKHREIHRTSGTMDDILIQQRDRLKSQLAETEDRLKKLKAQVGVVSLEETKRMHAEQVSILQQELFKSEADLAQYKAALSETSETADTGKPEQTNSPLASSPLPPPAITEEYRRVLGQVDHFERRERELLASVTLANPLARTNHLHLEEAHRVRSKLEKEHPGLLRTAVVPGLASPVTIPGADIFSQKTLVRSLEAKVRSLTNQLSNLRAEAKAIDEVEGSIVDLQRSRKILEDQFLYVERNLQQTGFDRDLGSGKSANISRIQAPSPAYRDFKKLYKTTATALFGGLGGGIALAFLIELLLDRTVKRPKDIEGVLRLPLFLTIPQLRFRSPRALPSGPSSNPAKPAKASPNGNGSNGQPGAELQPYHEALRDRLMSYFDVQQMTHKPKLIAVTSCADGAGVSSVANGLAASLSETGDGNVLLVDMRGERGSAHTFCKGKPACGLVDALEDETRSHALVHQNLYVVSADAADANLQRLIPRQFSSIIPRLKASDYDYIIFDMPPVGQTSITAKVSRFMDMVLMVIESNRTDRDVARRAGALLAESKATVATILNKQRQYVPAWLQQDFH